MSINAPANSRSSLYHLIKWNLDLTPILRRGAKGDIDRDVVGDPCIVWDEEAGTWRMFYFAQGIVGDATACALARDIEKIGPGDWLKQGLVALDNKTDLALKTNWHKWWVVQDASMPHRAAKIEGRYWALFVSREPEAESIAHSRKVIQVASAAKLAGPWVVEKDPILAPPDRDEIDGLNCDTPTAYWFEDRQEVLIFYKAYPRHAQISQAHAPFGSSLVAAVWHPKQDSARRISTVLRPASNVWASGWVGGLQLLPGVEETRWEGLLNASRTPPEQESLREPAPSMGGWAHSTASFPVEGWALDQHHSPLLSPDQVSPEMQAAGVQTNFWRHHLLSTPGGQLRIFFNSGHYGEEQMYSLVGRRP